MTSNIHEGFPGGAGGKESAYQCRRCKRSKFDPWVRKIPWRRKWLPTPVFLLRKFHGQRSLVGYGPQCHKKLNMTEQRAQCIWAQSLLLARQPGNVLSAFGHLLTVRSYQASLVAQRLKHLPAMWETRVRSLGQEDPLEKEMATHSSILAWRIPWTGEPGRLQSKGSQRVGHDWVTSLWFPLSFKELSLMSWF